MGSIRRQMVPYPGVAGTVTHMIRLVKEGQTDPQVRRYAARVIQKVRPKDHLSEVAALYYDVCRRVRYTRDPAETEWVQHPRVTLQEGHGDCDDMSIALASLLGARASSVGAPTAFATVGFRSNAGVNQYTHVFAQVKDPRAGWVVLDPVAGPKTRQMLKNVKQHKIYQS